MIIILTGPPAAGKNTISEILSKKRTKCAVIDVDVIRHMLVTSHKAPWDGEEGKRQQKLGVENACSLAINFVKDDSDVIILDVLQNDTAQLYKELLKDFQMKIILLIPSFEEAHIRFMVRGHSITEEEFELVYKWQQELTVYDEKIDNTGISGEECAEKLDVLL